MTRRLRVVVATPMSDEGAHLIEAIEPRIQLVRDAQLLPPMRYPGDFQGDPAFRRSAASEARFRELVNSAQVLFGIVEGILDHGRIGPAQLDAKLLKVFADASWNRMVHGFAPCDVKPSSTLSMKSRDVCHEAIHASSTSRPSALMQ